MGGSGAVLCTNVHTYYIIWELTRAGMAASGLTLDLDQPIWPVQALMPPIPGRKVWTVSDVGP